MTTKRRRGEEIGFGGKPNLMRSSEFQKLYPHSLRLRSCHHARQHTPWFDLLTMCTIWLENSGTILKTPTTSEHKKSNVSFSFCFSSLFLPLSSVFFALYTADHNELICLTTAHESKDDADLSRNLYLRIFALPTVSAFQHTLVNFPHSTLVAIYSTELLSRTACLLIVDR